MNTRDPIFIFLFVHYGTNKRIPSFKSQIIRLGSVGLARPMEHVCVCVVCHPGRPAPEAMPALGVEEWENSAWEGEESNRLQPGATMANCKAGQVHATRKPAGPRSDAGGDVRAAACSRLRWALVGWSTQPRGWWRLLIVLDGRVSCHGASEVKVTSQPC